MARILVTGGAGYIGSHTVKQLLKRGHDVTVFDNLSAGHRQAVPADRLVVGDLRDIDQVDHLLVVNRIEAVIHFAALALVGESVKNPAVYYATNLIYTLNLIERCRRNGIQKFVFSSTCATYGNPLIVPIAEDEKQKPINPYGNTKLAVEHALADYAAAYPFGFCLLRYFNASGATADGSLGEDHNPESHLIPIVLQVALGKRPHVEIFGTDYPTADGTCVRDYIHVDDLAEAHILALGKIVPGSNMAYNVGIGRGYSVREVIDTARTVTGKSIPVKEAPRRSGDPPELVANANKIRGELGWEPKYTDLQSIIETAWAWHSKHPNGYS
ncbi:MAG TPA: UDP-glucose 4-epimerase GalE [Gemmata sp.]|jgi:UDP-glucose-4-epimerase GalE|nr:UDP-glucose 4-epimerase GalE [Gemmata sp.]